MTSTFYAEDLAYVQHMGVGGFAERVAPELLALLRGLGIERAAGWWSWDADRGSWPVPCSTPAMI
jgi:hypothetical protein